MQHFTRQQQLELVPLSPSNVGGMHQTHEKTALLRLPAGRKQKSSASRRRLVQFVLFPGRHAPSGLQDPASLGARRPHGTRIRYIGGCRCLPCRSANSLYETQRAARKRAGRGNQLLPAGRARSHLSTLSRNHFGRRAISRISGVSQALLCRIRTGKQRVIRKDTERRILAVCVQHASGHMLVKAAPTWKLLGRLMKEGFSKAELARRIGVSRLRPVKTWTTAATAARVRAFYNKISAE